MKKKRDLMSLIAEANALHVVKIRYDVIKSGYSLYLEYVHENRRERRRLGIILSGKQELFHRDSEALRAAVAKRDETERMVTAGWRPFAIRQDVSFSSFADKVCQSKKPANREGYRAAVSHFLRLYGDLSLDKVMDYHAQRFLLSLQDRSPNTRNHYIAALRHIYDCAVREEILDRNPFRDIKKERIVPAREFLSESEVRALVDAPCEIPVVKSAFLFSCFTGLRWGDLVALTRSNLQENYLVFRQKKTGIPSRILIPEIVRELVSPGDRLFPLPSYDVMRRVLPQWIKAAGITKVITFHCARHTFATLQISLGTDIYVVSKMLGHSDVRTTQVYAKLVDQRRDDAMNLLASLLKR